MTVFAAMNRHNNCCTAAAASFARYSLILDTVALAVSVVVLLIGVRIIGMV